MGDQSISAFHSVSGYHEGISPGVWDDLFAVNWDLKGAALSPGPWTRPYSRYSLHGEDRIGSQRSMGYGEQRYFPLTTLLAWDQIHSLGGANSSRDSPPYHQFHILAEVPLQTTKARFKHRGRRPIHWMGGWKRKLAYMAGISIWSCQLRHDQWGMCLKSWLW